MRRSAASSAMRCWRRVIDLPEPQLREALDRLAAAGLVFARGTPAGGQLPVQARAGAGCRLRQLAAQPAAGSAPAYRCNAGRAIPGDRRWRNRRCWRSIVQEAGLAEKAVAYWLKAGQQALARSAMAEAVAQLRKGLDVLAGLPDGPWRQQQELDLQVALGTALTATKGWSAAEVGETLARAQSLWPSSSIGPSTWCR